MKHFWLNHAGNRELLLFFNGWGMNEQPFRHLEAGTLDVLMLFDYTTVDCELDFNLLLKQYNKTYLVAWSLGVWAAAEALIPPLPYPIDGIAVNGTLFPIDEQRGITPTIFQATLDSWNEAARERFNRRICDNPDKLFEEAELQRQVVGQRNELAALQQRIASQPRLNTSLFTLAVVGSKDRIFRPQAQENAWRVSDVPITRINVPHYPFALYHSWQETGFVRNS